MSRRTRKLRRENKKLEEALSYSDRFKVDHIVDDLKTTRLSRYEQELIRRDLLLMVIDGRSRGEKPQQIFGDDPIGFCEDIVAALPPPTAKDWILRIMRSVALGVWGWMLILLVLNNLIRFGTAIPEGMMQVRLFDVVYIFLLGFGSEFLSTVFNRRMLKRQPIMTVALYGCYIAVIVLLAVLYGIFRTGWLIPTQFVFAIIVFCGVLWLILNEFVD